MKRILVFTLTVFTILFTIASCGGKAKNTANGEANEESVNNEDINIQISETHFDNNWNKLNKSSSQLSKTEYDALKLGQLSFMGDFEDLQFDKGEVLLDDGKRQLLTIKTISSGEISEYLLGYINNTITDSLLVAYEDNVEYFSTTSSVISDNIITVTTIDFDYSGLEEISDTIINSYRITPDLHFDELIERFR